MQAEAASNQELTADQSDALLRILGDYARALDVLDQYDYQRLRVARDTVAAPENKPFELTPDNARQAINALRTQFGGSELFGTADSNGLNRFNGYAWLRQADYASNRN